MISSEVQRTLVKSPPELWSELSDPQSLARHLGELGEIEITRVEPENLVEWEAKGTTGTVQIKPSGWGTRVTLTVSRELPAGESAAPLAEEAPAPGEAEAGSPADASPTDAGSEPPAEAGPEPSLELETPADAQDEPETQAHTPSEAEAGDPPLGSESAAEDAPHRKPAPATEAARRAAGWPSSELEPAPAIESEPHAAEAFDPPAEPDGLQAWAVQAAIEPPEPVEHDELSPAPEPAPAAEPRRGFLARLFVRRRKPTAPADAAPVASFLLKAEDAEPADQDLELLDPLDEPVADAAETTDELLDPLDGPIADAAEAKEEPDLAAEEKAEPVGAPAPGPDAPPLVAGQHADIDAAAQPAEEQPLDAPTTAEPADEAHSLAEVADEDAPAADLSAELRAAEEVAAEHVEAVLTAVLDRLGSAHHRPFSRS